MKKKETSSQFQQRTANSGDGSKKPYETPKLDILGSVAEVTKGPNVGTVDLLFGSDGGFEFTGS